jgi:hypothetical protein
MAKKPVELGDDKTSLGFEADIDGMIEKFMQTVFDTINFNIDNNDLNNTLDDTINNTLDNTINEEIDENQNIIDNTEIDNAILNLEAIERWFNEVGISELYDDVFGEFTNNINNLTDININDVNNNENVETEQNLGITSSLSESLKREQEELKNKIIQEFPKENNNITQLYSGGLRDMLKMFIKKVYKILGFFAQKLLILLEPIIALVKQLFMNFDPLYGKMSESLLRGNPFPVIPDMIAYNMLIALTSMAPPLNAIHVADQVLGYIEQAKQLADIASQVLNPVIQFMTSPGSLISSFLKTPGIENKLNNVNDKLSTIERLKKEIRECEKNSNERSRENDLNIEYETQQITEVIDSLNVIRETFLENQNDDLLEIINQINELLSILDTINIEDDTKKLDRINSNIIRNINGLNFNDVVVNNAYITLRNTLNQINIDIIEINKEILNNKELNKECENQNKIKRKKIERLQKEIDSTKVDEGNLPFDGFGIPFPEISLGFLGITIPSMDKYGLFNSGSLSFDKNFSDFKNNESIRNLFKEGVNPQDIFNNIGLDINVPNISKKYEDNYVSKQLEKSSLMKDIKFMDDLIKNPLLQMDFIRTIDDFIIPEKNGIPSHYAKYEFYREPYITTGSYGNSIDNKGWQHNFDFFKNFPLYDEEISATKTNPITNKDTTTKIKKKGLWNTIQKSGLHKNFDFIEKFYNMLYEYGNGQLTDLPEIMQYLYLNNGAVAQTISNSTGWKNESFTSFIIDNINDKARLVNLEEPIYWDLRNRDYKIYINPQYTKLSKEASEISNIGDNFSDSIVVNDYSVEWDGDEIFAYRNWLTDKQKIDYFYNYINEEKRRYYFYSIFNEDEKKFIIDNSDIDFISLKIENSNDRQILDKLTYYGNGVYNDTINMEYPNYCYDNNLDNLNYQNIYGFKILSEFNSQYKKIQVTDFYRFDLFWDTVLTGDKYKYNYKISSENVVNYKNLPVYDYMFPIVESGSTGLIVYGNDYKTVDNKSILLLDNIVLELINKYLNFNKDLKYFHNSKNYVNPGEYYFYLDNIKNENLDFTSQERRKEFHRKYLSQKVFFKFKIQWKNNNFVDDLFDNKLKDYITDIKKYKDNLDKIEVSKLEIDQLKDENTAYGFLFKTPQINTAEERLKKLKEQNVVYQELAEKQFIEILERSFQFNMWNTILFVSDMGNELNFRHGKNLDGSQVEVIFQNQRVTTKWDYKKFKMDFWKMIPYENIPYFQEYMESFTLYFKKYFDYKEGLCSNISEILRISNSRLVNEKEIKGVLDYNDFRKLVNKNVENSIPNIKSIGESSKYRLAETETGRLFGNNYNPDGVTTFKASSLKDLDNILKKSIGTITSPKLTMGKSLPGFMSWLTGIVSFMKDLIMLPINLVMTVLETLMDIVKDLLSLNLPGVVSNIISLISFLSPNLSLFQNMIMSGVATSMIESLLDSIEAYNKQGLNENKDNFDNFVSEMSKKSQKKEAECLAKMKEINDRKASWLNEIGLSNTIFATQDGIKEWIKSVGLDPNSLGIDFSKYRKESPSGIYKDTMMCMGDMEPLFQPTPDPNLEEQLLQCNKKKKKLSNELKYNAKKYFNDLNKVLSIVNSNTSKFESFRNDSISLSLNTLRTKLSILNAERGKDFEKNKNPDIDTIGIIPTIRLFIESKNIQQIVQKDDNGISLINKLEFAINDLNQYVITQKDSLSRYKNQIIQGIKTKQAKQYDLYNNISNYIVSNLINLVNDLKSAIESKNKLKESKESFKKQKDKCKKIKQIKEGIETANSAEELLSKVTDVGKQFTDFLNSMSSGIPSNMKQYFNTIKIITTEAFPQLFMDVVVELFKWIIGKICEALPFLCSGKKSDSSTDYSKYIESETSIDEIKTKTTQNDVLGLTSPPLIGNEGILSWLESVGLNQDFLNYIKNN